MPKNPNLQHNQSINSKRLTYGVPSALMLGAIAATVILFVSVGFVAFVASFLVLIPPLIILHRDDDIALTILLDKVARPSFYSSGGARKKIQLVLKRYGDRYTVTPINSL